MRGGIHRFKVCVGGCAVTDLKIQAVRGRHAGRICRFNGLCVCVCVCVCVMCADV